MMTSKEFRAIRQKLQKTQKQMAQLLGISIRAVQSFEQDWRRVPISVERQSLFLYGLRVKKEKKTKNCWDLRRCSLAKRKKCPAWEFQAGHLCWFITGTLCQGVVVKNWEQKIKMCRKCLVFRSILSLNDSSKVG